MSKVILFKNNKGGVGKSLLCFWVADTLSKIKKTNEDYNKILILTSDSQNNILQLAGITSKFGKGLEEHIETGNGEIIRLRKNLFYIPLTSTKIKTTFDNKFTELMKEFKKEYDYVFIDGSPVLKLDNIFIKVADKIVIPTYLDDMTTKGVTNLIKEVGGEKVALVIPNRCGRSKLEKQYFSKLKIVLDKVDIKLFDPIYQSSKIMKLIEQRKTIFETKNKQYKEIQSSFAQIVKEVM